VGSFAELMKKQKFVNCQIRQDLLDQVDLAIYGKLLDLLKVASPSTTAIGDATGFIQRLASGGPRSAAVRKATAS
jgi:hypothetical protein